MKEELPTPRRKATARLVVTVYLGGTVVLIVAVAIVWLTLVRN